MSECLCTGCRGIFSTFESMALLIHFMCSLHHTSIILNIMNLKILVCSECHFYWGRGRPYVFCIDKYDSTVVSEFKFSPWFCFGSKTCATPNLIRHTGRHLEGTLRLG